MSGFVPARFASLLVVVAVLAAACTDQAPASDVGPLPTTTPAEVRQRLAASGRPVLLNVWASWCAPCRSEAPLLLAAHREHGDRVDFLGVAVRDSQTGARAFIEEFGLDGFDHLFDATGAVPADLGGRGVPITFFFAPGGQLVRMHSGVIDERTLILLIDEVTR